MKRLFMVSVLSVLLLTLCNLAQIFPSPTLAPTSPSSLAPTTPPLASPTSAVSFTLTPSTAPVINDTPTQVPTPTSSAAMLTPTSQDANCRYGPGIVFLAIGGLKVGKTALILGTITDKSWWQIQNPQDVAGNYCWVKDSVVTTSGDLSTVPVIAAPAALVTAVTVTTPAVVHGTCGGPNATSFVVSITTNGPATVIYHVEIYNADNSLRNATANATRVFAAYATQTFDPGGSYKTDCGSFYIRAIVTSPNSMSARADWKVVSP